MGIPTYDLTGKMNRKNDHFRSFLIDFKFWVPEVLRFVLSGVKRFLSGFKGVLRAVRNVNKGQYGFNYGHVTWRMSHVT